MNWKQEFEKLESQKKWKESIAFLQSIIQEDPNNKEAYLYILYSFMNIAFIITHDELRMYSELAKKYFRQSYQKFSKNAEYLFFASFAVQVAGAFFDADRDQMEYMINKAIELDPTNLVYQFNEIEYQNVKIQYEYAHKILDPHGSIQLFLKEKGFPGQEVLGCFIGWATVRLQQNNENIQ